LTLGGPAPKIAAQFPRPGLHDRPRKEKPVTNRKLTALLASAILTVVFLPAAAFADAAAGKAVFEANCASCHGKSGKGDGPVGAALNPPPRDFTVGDFKFDANSDGTPGEDDDLKLVIQKGAMAYGGSALMAPWPTLTDDQINDIIAYIRSLKAS
jgi:mono/diheme cytochrome c family protein